MFVVESYAAVRRFVFLEGHSRRAELLFEVFSQRYEHGSTIVTSNLPFEEWTAVLGSPNTSPHSAKPRFEVRIMAPRS